MSPPVVECLTLGLCWVGSWVVPYGMHFEWRQFPVDINRVSSLSLHRCTPRSLVSRPANSLLAARHDRPEACLRRWVFHRCDGRACIAAGASAEMMKLLGHRPDSAERRFRFPKGLCCTCEQYDRFAAAFVATSAAATLGLVVNHPVANLTISADGPRDGPRLKVCVAARGRARLNAFVDDFAC